jgi:hypothetical protein
MNKAFFRGEMAPCDHAVQIYDDHETFMDALHDYAAAGLRADESVVLISTPSHLAGLEARLRGSGIDVSSARAEDRYITLDAEETLAQFMRNDWPDDDRFFYVVGEVIERARAGGRNVRAFGEMVAILWANGHAGATVRLEFLWNRLLRTEKFPLFCAYPKAGFTRGARDSMSAICEMHSKVIGAPAAA